MTQDEQAPSKFNVQFRDVTDSQVVIGDYNRVAQTIGLTPQQTAELKSLFDEARKRVDEQAEPEQRDQALVQTGELERAVVAEQPDPGRIRNVLRWFKNNAPQLVGTVVSVVVNPLVGKVVEGAGQAIADQFRELLKEEL